MLDILGCAIKGVPDVVWSGVLASVITLGGVWVSNWSNNKRLNVQLVHDSAEKEKERIYTLRSNVYLSAVEYIEVAMIHLSSLSSRDLTKSDMSSEIQAIASAMAKLKLVAEPETSKLANELGTALGSVFMNLMPCLLPLQKTKAEIDDNNNLYNKAVEDEEELEKKIDLYLQSGEGDEAKFEALQAARRFRLEQGVKFADAIADAHRKHRTALQHFNSVLIAEMRPLTDVQLRLMIATRSDLGLTSNAADIQRQLELQWSVMSAAYGDAMTKIHSESD